MSQQTIRLLLSLLDQVTLQGSQPNLEESAALIVSARRELETLLLNGGAALED